MISYVKRGDVYFFSSELLNSESGITAFTFYGQIEASKKQSITSFAELVFKQAETTMLKTMNEQGAVFGVIFRMIAFNKIGSQ